ncbi:MAG: hypothetical protein V7709_04325 [Halioglobus sp.]
MYRFKGPINTFAWFWVGCIVAVVSGPVNAQGKFSGDDSVFCADAQALIAQTDLTAKNTVHDEYDAFVESKSVAFPLETQQFYSNPLGSDAKISKVVSCKMRTAGSIEDAYSDAQESAVVGEDTSCEFLIATMLSDISSEIPPAKRALNLTSVEVDEEELTFMGPMWLDPWPFEPVYQDESGTVHLKSRALYVPWSIFIPAPAAFKGVYYCHLPAPAYLRALLKGEAAPPNGE